MSKNYRSAVTGRYETPAKAKRKPREHVAEARKPARKK